MEENNKKQEQSGGVKRFYKKNKVWINFVATIMICLLIAKLITTFVFLSVMVSGSSMETTLTNGDKGITDSLFYKLSGIDRFDIVILEEKGYDNKLVKRVIGLPGETLKYVEGQLYINGEPVEENFISDEVKKQTLTRYGNDIKEITLKDNEYYVLGDNRGNSTDSRYFGPIEKSQIKGVGMMLFASCKSVSETGACEGLKLRWPKIVK